jgi:hypothetical protein
MSRKARFDCIRNPAAPTNNQQERGMSVFWLLLISAGLMTALVRLVALRERWTLWSWLIVFLASALVLGGLWMMIQGAPG